MFQRRRIRWHRPIWVALSADVRIWSRRVLMLGLAIGLVLMHHLVGAHQHGPTDGVPGSPIHHTSESPSGAPVAVADTGLGGHASAGLAVAGAEHPPVTAEARGGPTELREHPAGNGPGAILVVLHMCLAVLGAALLLAVVLAILLWWRTPRRSGRPLTPAGFSVFPRPPPMPVRLAQLQLLRL